MKSERTPNRAPWPRNRHPPGSLFNKELHGNYWAQGATWSYKGKLTRTSKDMTKTSKYMTRTSKVLTRHEKDIQGLIKAWQERTRWTTGSRRPPTARTHTSTRQDLGRLWRWPRSDRSSLTFIRPGLAFELLALLLILKIMLMKALAITVIQVVFGFLTHESDHCLAMSLTD